MISIYIDWLVSKISVNNYEVVSLLYISSSRKIQFVSVDKRNLVSKKTNLWSVEKHLLPV